MRKIKIISLVASLLISVNIFAQTLDEGKRFLYYEKYTSAKDVFNKLVNANPANTDAAYWLGQAYIGMEDTASAKALYQRTLAANPNAALLLVGMGHIELLENKTNDARNRFETAISLTKAKDANVLNAIGKANVDAKAGDAIYAIEKLKLAAERDKKNAEIPANLGDAYRKLTDGSNAQLSYQDALAINPNYARASFMIGRIYQTQGFTQEPIYIRYFNDAMAKDANYAPLYSWLAEYYYRRDINKARDYLDKYVVLADADSKNCYYQASFLYASGKNQEAINKSNECINAAGGNPYPKIYGIQAYAYDKMGDSLNSKKYFETYFNKVAKDQIGPNDYATYGRTLLKFPGNEGMASEYVLKAVALDTIDANKIDYINSIANSYLAVQNYGQAADWYTKLLSIKKNVTKTDLYNAGINYNRAGNYKASDSVFVAYQQKYPEDVLGFYYGAIAKANIDSTSALALAMSDYQKVIELAKLLPDSTRSKQLQIAGHRYMINYYYSIKKDNATTLSYINKILEIDPANELSLQNKQAILDAMKRGSDTKSKTKTDEGKQKVTPKKTKAKAK